MPRGGRPRSPLLQEPRLSPRLARRFTSLPLQGLLERRPSQAVGGRNKQTLALALGTWPSPGMGGQQPFLEGAGVGS